MYPRMSPGAGMRGDSWPKNGNHPRLRPAAYARTASRPVRRRLWPARAPGWRRPRRTQRRVRQRHGHRLQRVAARQLVRPRPPACWAPSRSTSNTAKPPSRKSRSAPATAVSPKSTSRPEASNRSAARRYWPILEACAANDFPVSLHLGGTSGHASTGGGWPSFYHEEHPSYVQTMQTLVTSLVCEGVFERIPNLKIVLVEGGFAWLPALCWRLDKHWKRLKAEVPLPDKIALGIRPRAHLGHHPADRGTRTPAGHALDPGMDRPRPGDVLHGLSALGPGRPPLRLQDRAARGLEAGDLSRPTPRPCTTLTKPPYRQGPARL